MVLISVQSANGLSTYWFTYYRGYESYLTLDLNGEYVDGTFTADSKFTTEQIRVAKRNSQVK